MISVIIPCYNEEKHIDEVLKRMPSNIDEIIVVDDGSKDKTAEIVKGFPKIKLVKHEINKGKGAAMMTGVKNSKGDIIVFMDGDMQHNPMEINLLVEPILNGKADFVNGSRVLADWERFPITRKAGNIIGRKIVKFFTKADFTDPLSGFKAIKRNALENINLKAKHYEIETDIIYGILKKDLKFTELPVSTQYADEKSNITLMQNMKNITFLIKEGFKFRK